MRNTSTALLIGFLFTQTGCVTYNYFLSPFNGSQNPYQAIPLKSDSIKGATYASLVGSFGAANDALRDDQFDFRGSIHRSNTFGNLHLFYGGSVAFGSYSANGYDFGKVDSGTNTYVNGPTKNMYYGGAAFNGGLNYIIPISNGGEWRVIGLETSLNREFGDYLSFRKGLPDSLTYTIDRNGWTGSLGVTTEIIGKKSPRGSFGYKFAFGYGFNGINNYYQFPYTYTTTHPLYMSHTLHFSTGNWTGFGQFNFGYKAFSFQFGAELMLGKHGQ